MNRENINKRLVEKILLSGQQPGNPGGDTPVYTCVTLAGEPLPVGHTPGAWP